MHLFSIIKILFFGSTLLSMCPGLAQTAKDADLHDSRESAILNIHVEQALLLDLTPDLQTRVTLSSPEPVEIKGFSSISENRILILGSFISELEIENRSLKSNAGTGKTPFIAAFDGSGELLWVRCVTSLSRNHAGGSPGFDGLDLDFEPITENEVPMNDPDGHGPDGSGG